jgi:hypothetical protein
MKDVSVKVYKFDELSPKVQEEIRDRRRENMDLSDQLTDIFAYRLSVVGFPTGDIRYKLSSSQGDGVAFYGVVPDTLKLFTYLEKEGVDVSSVKPYANEVEIAIKKSTTFHLYNHEHTMNVCISGGPVPEDAKIPWGAIETVIQKYVKKISLELKSEGDDLVDSCTSDEYLNKELKEDDLWYFENGHMYIEVHRF